jgi:valyl-tRNA synthetase
MSEIPKTYEPQAIEEKWYADWLAHDFFKADPASEKPAYSIVIPPPNVTGMLTLGHVLNNTIQDILARRARMLGKEVLWLPGTDHAGIATQTVVERALKKQGAIKHRNDLGREKFLEKVWEWKEQYGGIIIQQLKKLGASCDWSRERFTMDAEYSKCVQRVFVDLYKKGLIYRGKRMVNWCPVSLTALSDEEVIMKPQNGVMYHFTVEVAELPGTLLTVATTRPETIPGDTAIAVNPKDERYAHLIGKHVVRPLPAQLPQAERLIPIVGDEHVDFAFGTGVLKVTPAHDKADFEIGVRHNLPVIDVMNPDGTMNAIAGESLVGLDRFEARKVAVENLRDLGVLMKEEPHQNNVGYSERADVPIEPRLSEQWFLKYPSVEKSRAVVADGGMKFYPERWAKVYDHWLGGIQDWCISRQLWWGHRVPVWRKRFSLNSEWIDLPVGVDLLTLQDQGEVECQEGSYSMQLGHFAVFRFFSDRDLNEANLLAATTSDLEARELETRGFVQDPDVLDTWFSSWLWPFATMGWREKTATLAKFYPTTDLVTGPDIIFFWVARMIMAGYEWMGEMPFKNVYFTGIIRDKQGRKMSKSLGNSPDPLEIIAKFGADALRFGVMRSAPLGADVLFDEKNVELGRNFCTKLWNAARFREMQGGESEDEINPALLTSDDKWILLRLDAAIREVSAALDEYRFSDAAQALYRFFWSEYCDWYVEASKANLGSKKEDLGSADGAVAEGGALPKANFLNPQLAANTLAVMDFVLGHTLRLFHPFMPFITEELWQGMGFNGDLPEKQGGETIMFAHWPAPFDDDFKAHYSLGAEDEAFANAKYEVVNLGRGLRRDFNIASNKRTRFVLKPTTPVAAHEAEVIRLLLNAEPFDVLENYDAPKGTPTALTPLGELFLPLEGLIDVAAERERLAKEIAKVEAELLKVRAKLADENFAAKVPPKVLDEHKQRETTWAEKLTQLHKMREALGS